MKITSVAIVAKETTSTVSQFYLAHRVHYRLDFEKSVLDLPPYLFLLENWAPGFREMLRRVNALSINFEYTEVTKYPVVG